MRVSFLGISFILVLGGCSLLAASDEELAGGLSDASSGTCGASVDACHEDADLSCVTQLSAGVLHTCALKADGAVWCWGYNRHGELGRAPASLPESATPVQVEGVSGGRSVSAGATHGCASGGTALWCWGGSDEGVSVFQPDAESNAAACVSAGFHRTCAVTPAGKVRCWGASLGAAPAAEILGLTGVTEVATGGAQTCARRGAEPLWCWGGEFGDDPPKFPGPPAWPEVERTVALSASSAEQGRTCARRADGTVTCFVGKAATPVAGLSQAVQIAVGGSHLCARRSDCSVWCEGSSDAGQVGTGATAAESELVAVPGMTDVVDLVAGDSHNCALRKDGSVWCWGAGANGQLGNGAWDSGSAPVRVDDAAMCR